MQSISSDTPTLKTIRAVRGAAAFYLQHRFTALRLALGVIYIWFGALKFESGTSPAAKLATDTMSAMTFHSVSANVSRPLLALMETSIGLGFIALGFIPVWMRRLTAAVFLAQVFGAMSSVVLEHQQIWSNTPFVPTLSGQYVIKDLVLLTAGVVALAAPLPVRTAAPAAATATATTEIQPAAAAATLFSVSIVEPE